MSIDRTLFIINVLIKHIQNKTVSFITFFSLFLYNANLFNIG
jgi:hypothetical protein